MIRVMQITVVAQDLGVQPFVNAYSRNDADVRFEVGVFYEQGWRMRSLIFHDQYVLPQIAVIFLSANK